MATFGNNIQSPFNTNNPNEPRKKKTGTGFTNLQKLIGASSGQRLGQAIGSGISGQAQQFKSQLRQEQQQFGEKLGQAESVFDPQKRQDIISQAGTAGEPTEEQVKAFETFRSGQLGDQSLGKGLQGFGKLSAQASDVSQQLKDIGSTGGRYNLLQRYASGGKQYAPGAKRLDALLLGQSGGDQALQQARLGNVGLGQQLKQAQEGAQAQFGVAAGRAKDFGQETEELLTKAIDPIKAATEEKFKKMSIEQPERLQKLKDEIAASGTTGRLSREAAEYLGLSEGQDIYGLSGQDLSTLLKTKASMEDIQKAGKVGVMTAQDYARLNALSKLAGKELLDYNVSDKSQIGSLVGKEGFTSSADERAKILEQAKQTMEQRLANEGTGASVPTYQSGIFSSYIPIAGENLKADQVMANLNWLQSHTGWQDAYNRYRQAGLSPDDAATRAYSEGNTGRSSAYAGEEGYKMYKSLQDFYNKIGKNRRISFGDQNTPKEAYVAPTTSTSGSIAKKI